MDWPLVGELLGLYLLGMAGGFWLGFRWRALREVPHPAPVTYLTVLSEADYITPTVRVDRHGNPLP